MFAVEPSYKQGSPAAAAAAPADESEHAEFAQVTDTDQIGADDGGAICELAPDEIVAVEIDLWPFSIRAHAGDTLQLRINGVDLLKRPEAPDLPGAEARNVGRSVLYTGGRYDSHLLLPLVDGIWAQ
jgi:hypothetical protein